MLNMQTVIDLTSPQALQALAIPSNLRLGQEIFAKGDVQLVESAPSSVKARIKGFPGRKTSLAATDQVLSWGCTCSSEPDLFCKHLVATVLAAHAAPSTTTPSAPPPAQSV